MKSYLYLLNITFYAGSDEPEDVDKDLLLLHVDRKITESEMKDIFIKVNSLLDTFNENADFPISYEQGLNLDTLMEGIEIYTKGKFVGFDSDCGPLNGIDNYYVIEQWQ